MSYFLYILQSVSFDKYYIGISSDPIWRLMFHNSIEKGFTSRYQPWEIVFTQEFSSKLSAHKSEL
jgi:predicted GIY-YIG superfamily endonuclease